MIAISFHLKSFTRLATYLEQGRRVAWTKHRNLVYADNLQQAAREMRLVARVNENVEKPVLHLTLSWAPDDEPTMPDMQHIAKGVLHSIDITGHQMTLVAHADKAYAHVHMMVNRIHPERGTAHPRGLYYRQIQTYLRHTERAYGFKETPGHLFQLEGQQPPDRSQSLSRKAYRTTARTGEQPFQVLVQNVAQKDFEQATSWSDLTRRLAREGLQLKKRRRGLVVTDGVEYAKSSSIARGVSRHTLEQRFGMAYTDFLAGKIPSLARRVRSLAPVDMSQGR